MMMCPSCKSLNPAGAEACAVCGEPSGDAQRLPSAPTTVVNRSSRPSDIESAPALTVRTPPPTVLPAPMVEPIVALPIESPPGSLSGTALTRGLADYPSDTGSGAAAAAVTVRGPAAVGLASATASGTVAGSAAIRVPLAAPRLVVVRGERLDAAFPILDGKNYVGRCADRPVDIDLDGQEPVERTWTSRQHAVLTWDHGTLLIEDLNSLNGTFVNRERIHPGHRQVLRPGDVVQIGTVQMRVVV
ncbi:MAG TPA: FHA domain-containing protein [Fimbriiglobus sp.]|nr:FHA domain-containing protein [Fimbriiglobus sp.]